MEKLFNECSSANGSRGERTGVNWDLAVTTTQYMQCFPQKSQKAGPCERSGMSLFGTLDGVTVGKIGSQRTCGQVSALGLP